MTKLIMPSSVVFISLWQIALLLNWSECPTFAIQFLGHLVFSPSAIVFNAMQNISILCAVNTYYAFKYPSSLIMIRSRMETFTLTLEEAKILRAMDAVARQISADNQSEDFFYKTAKRLLNKKTGRAKKIAPTSQGGAPPLA